MTDDEKDGIGSYWDNVDEEIRGKVSELEKKIDIINGILDKEIYMRIEKLEKHHTISGSHGILLEKIEKLETCAVAYDIELSELKKNNAITRQNDINLFNKKIAELKDKLNGGEKSVAIKNISVKEPEPQTDSKPPSILAPNLEAIIYSAKEKPPEADAGSARQTDAFNAWWHAIEPQLLKIQISKVFPNHSLVEKADLKKLCKGYGEAVNDWSFYDSFTIKHNLGDEKD